MRSAPALALWLLAVSPAAAATSAPDSSRLQITTPDERGTPLVVTGRVLNRDGKTPARGVRVGVYHTDASGDYGEHPTRRSYPPNRDARLSGWLVTDAAGRFEIRTIHPGAYPGGMTPEHIHFIVRGVNCELRFADDPILRRTGRIPNEGQSMVVRPVRKGADGVEHVTVEWRLR